ncbi:MAG: TRAP transporter small permease [Deltaproteobacteria bacterium]|nr:TRAP transporter small permease [Deltaproteobacteria bacterium]
MVSYLVKILKLIDENLEKFLSIFFLLTMVVLLSAIVFFRFVLNRGLAFAEELDRMAFVWMVYTAAAYAAQRGAHIRLEAVGLILPEKINQYMRYIADLLWIGFNLVIIKEGLNVVVSMFKYRYESPAMGWSMAYVYTIVPLSFALMTFRIVQRQIRNLGQSAKTTAQKTGGP